MSDEILEDAFVINLKSRSLKESVDTLVEAFAQAYAECPDAENKTFEEIAEWAGKRVILTEKKQDE